jgi:hypothetical protein
MCEACRIEYETPSDRRYHAQPNACARCGPRLSQSTSEISEALWAGAIVALKGIGGFQLCDARDAGTVSRLRQRKARDYKPFAVMIPSLAVAHEYCVIDEHEQTGSSLRAKKHTSATRADFDRVLRIPDERKQMIENLERTRTIQFERIAQMQVQLDQLQRVVRQRKTPRL